MGADERAVQEVVAKYHQAFRDLDVDAAADCIAETFFRVERKGGQWVASKMAYYFREPWRQEGKEWVAAHPGAKYEVKVDFGRTEVNGDNAIVQTTETGAIRRPSGEEETWTEAHNTWFVTKRDGRWRLVAAVWGGA